MSDEDTITSIGNYKVLKMLASGGMGEVYLAYDQERQKEIVLKRLKKKRLGEEGMREQFLNEAKILSELAHPNIVPLYDMIEENDSVAIVMPYIEGKSVNHLIAEAFLRERRGEPAQDAALTMAKIFMQVCQAVAFAHSKKILHRDLKPSNIIVRDDGQAVVLDWGLVASLTAENAGKLSIEKEKEVAGTTLYLAPEFTKGEAPSFQSDIYALGLILYEMLTLRVPFHRNTVTEYGSNLDIEVLVDPMAIAPFRGTNRELSRIALKCLQRKPEDRYRTVDEIVADLRPAMLALQRGLPDDAARRLFDAGNYQAALKEYELLQSTYKETLIGQLAAFQAALCMCRLGDEDGALTTVDSLEGTQNAMLTCLGRAIIFQALEQEKQELASYEELFSRFLHHPLIDMAKKTLHERITSYDPAASHFASFMLLGHIYLPVETKLPELHSKQLSFMKISEQEVWPDVLKRPLQAIQLAHHLKKPEMLQEIFQLALRTIPTPFVILELVLLALASLKAYRQAYRLLDQLWQVHLDVQAYAKLTWIQKTIKLVQAGCTSEKISFLAEVPPRLTGEFLYPFFLLLDTAVGLKRYALVRGIVKELLTRTMADDLRARLEALRNG